MLRWQAFTGAAPEIAAAAERLIDPSDPIAFLATVSASGLPHLAPVCPIYSGEGLYLSVGSQTVKRRDIQETGQYVLHAFLGKGDEEFQVAGRAWQVTDPAETRKVQADIPFQYQEDDPLVELRIQRALWAYWIDPGQPGTRVVRKTWYAGQSA